MARKRYILLTLVLCESLAAYLGLTWLSLALSLVMAFTIVEFFPPKDGHYL